MSKSSREFFEAISYQIEEKRIEEIGQEDKYKAEYIHLGIWCKESDSNTIGTPGHSSKYKTPHPLIISIVELEINPRENRDEKKEDDQDDSSFWMVHMRNEKSDWF